MDVFTCLRVYLFSSPGETMKAIDIALKDLQRSFRSVFAVVFMFGVPLLVTGMFYFMFGNIAQSGGFELPKTKVIIANMDAGGPNSRSTRRIFLAVVRPRRWVT